MSIWKLFERTLSATTLKVAELQKKKEELPVPTIVVTPVLEEREEYLEFGYKIEDTPKTTTVQVSEITPTTSPTASDDGNDETTKGLGISGVQYEDPLNEVDDLLAILGLDVEAEKEEVEDEIEKILEREIDVGLASKLVEKSRVLFLELGREWREVVEREYLPAKREAKSIIWESYAMEQFKKSETNTRRSVAVQVSREEKLFAAIVLADVATKDIKAARVAAEKIHNLQTLALQKYATRLKDHKILPLASYRRYVRRVKRMEREMEGWQAKEKACKRILVVGGEVLGLLGTDGKIPGSPDSGYEE